MKKNNVILGLSAFLLIASLFTTGCGKEVKISKKAVVGFENGEISANDYYKEIKEDNISRIIDMIDHNLLDEKYKKTDEEDKDVKKQIDNLKSTYSDGPAFKQVIEQYFGAESEEELEEILRLEYKREQAVNDYIEKHLSDKEIKKYYDENVYGDMSAKHILISTNVADNASDEEKEEAEEEALKKAKEVIEKLEDGKDFDKLAKKYSDDEGSATNGGDLGKFSYDEMVEEFSSACAKLKVNEYSKEPIKSSFGYHIILKTAQEKKPSLKKVKNDIKEKLREQKLEDSKTLYYETLDSIRKDNGITWNDSAMKKAYSKFIDKLKENAKKDK